MLVLGILAVVALPRFFDRSDFDTLKLYDECMAATRHAQKLAVAQHANVFVLVGANSLSACFDAACATKVTNPGTGSALVLRAPRGVTLSATTSSFSFDALGKPSAAVTVNIAGASLRTFMVEPETGFVHR
jgi:MSHA pilin protein MshC